MTAPVFDVFTPFQVQLIIIRETDDADYGAAIARLLKALDGDVLSRLSTRESTLCKEIIQLKRVPAEKPVELDSFKGALQKVEVRRRNSEIAGENAFTTKSKK